MGFLQLFASIILRGGNSHSGFVRFYRGIDLHSGFSVVKGGGAAKHGVLIVVFQLYLDGSYSTK